MSNDSKSTDQPFPTSGRLAAVDFGTVRIGIAICDPDWILASPLEVHPAANWREDSEYFRKLARREQLVGFVVGLPIHSDGGESQKSIECRIFARWLSDSVGLPVRLFDERFTTADAIGRMAGAGYTKKKKQQRVDAIAAQVILESFLEACRYRNATAGQPVDAKPTGGDSL